MRLQPKQPTVTNPPAWFTGEVHLDGLASPQEGDQRMTVAVVRFPPGARTAWHSHARGQTLHVTEGVALMGTRDGTVLEVGAGQTVYTPPGEEHWHGATPEHYMQHLAMFEAADDPAESTRWAEHVTESEYRRP